MICRITLIMLAFAYAVHAGTLRSWTGTNGKTLEAEFVSQSNGEVALRLATGDIINTRLVSLSQPDREYISSRAVSASANVAQSERPAKADSTAHPKVNIATLFGKRQAELARLFPGLPAEPGSDAKLSNWGGWKAVSFLFNGTERLTGVSFTPTTPLSEAEAKRIVTEEFGISLPESYEKRVLILVAYRDMIGKIKTVNFKFVDWKTGDHRIKEIGIFFNIGWDE